MFSSEIEIDGAIVRKNIGLREFCVLPMPMSIGIEFHCDFDEGLSLYAESVCSFDQTGRTCDMNFGATLQDPAVPSRSERAEGVTDAQKRAPES